MVSEYYILEEGQKLGPFTEQELKDKPLEPDDIVLLPSQTQGTPAYSMPEFGAYFKEEGIYYPTKENTITYFHRLAAFVIDVAILTIVIVILGVVFFPQYFTPENLNGLKNNQTVLFEFKMGMFAIITLYNSFFESTRLMGSIGKSIFGIAVVDELGYALTFKQAFGRNFGKIISEFIFYIGYISMFWTERHQALHDQLARCFVVNKNR